MLERMAILGILGGLCVLALFVYIAAINWEQARIPVFSGIVSGVITMLVGIVASLKGEVMNKSLVVETHVMADGTVARIGKSLAPSIVVNGKLITPREQVGPLATNLLGLWSLVTRNNTARFGVQPPPKLEYEEQIQAAADALCFIAADRFVESLDDKMGFSVGATQALTASFRAGSNIENTRKLLRADFFRSLKGNTFAQWEAADDDAMHEAHKQAVAKNFSKFVPERRTVKLPIDANVYYIRSSANERMSRLIIERKYYYKITVEVNTEKRGGAHDESGAAQFALPVKLEAKFDAITAGNKDTSKYKQMASVYFQLLSDDLLGPSIPALGSAEA